MGTPGPLATVALSLFGNGSFFHLASERSQKEMNYTMRDICQSENYPFQRLGVESRFYTELCVKKSNQYREYFQPTGGYRSLGHSLTD